MTFPAGCWEVKAWITAPGDFPQLVLQTVRVRASDCEGAAWAGRRDLAQGSADRPVVVAVRRIPLEPPNVKETPMTQPPQYVLVTRQPGAVPEDNVYGPSPNPKDLEGAGELLSAGASPPMVFDVVELQPAKWGDL